MITKDASRPTSQSSTAPTRRVSPFSLLWIRQRAHPPTADATAVTAATESDNHVGTWSVYVQTLSRSEWGRVLGWGFRGSTGLFYRRAVPAGLPDKGRLAGLDHSVGGCPPVCRLRGVPV